MRVVIATTSGFHLRHLARELAAQDRDIPFRSYLPKFRTVQYGIPAARTRSLFWATQPWATCALIRFSKRIQQAGVDKMLELADDHVCRQLPPCDVFIGLSAMAIRSARAAKERYGATVIIDRGSRHVLSQQSLIAKPGIAGLSPVYIQRELGSYEAADIVALPSAHALESFREFGHNDDRLFKNVYGVDLGQFRPSEMPPLRPLKLVFVGGWSYQKGVDVLSEALDRLPDCTLTHIGTNVNVPYPVNSRFDALGHVQHERLPGVLKNFHVLVLPSRQDGFGMVLLEALASGLAVVASDKTGGPDIRELVARKDLVRIAKAGSVDAFVEEVQSVGDSVAAMPPGRGILSASEREFFSWRAYANRYWDYLVNAHSSRGSGRTGERLQCQA